MFNSLILSALNDHIDSTGSNNYLQYVLDNGNVNIKVYTLDKRPIFSSVHLLIVNDTYENDDDEIEYNGSNLTNNKKGCVIYNEEYFNLTIYNKSSEVKVYELESNLQRKYLVPVHILVDKFEFCLNKNTRYEILIDYLW